MFDANSNVPFVAGDDTVIGDQSYQYLSTDDMKFLHDDSISPTKVCWLYLDQHQYDTG